MKKRDLLLSQYDYREFRQTKAIIKDKTKDFSRIASSLLFTCGYGWPAEKPSETREASLKDIFGREVVSSKYKLYYGYAFRGMVPPQKIYVAITTDRTSAFIIDNKDNFNDFISSLNLSLKDHKEVTNLVEIYLDWLPYSNLTPQILWKLADKEEDKNWMGRISFRMWFATHMIKYRFYPPKIKKIEDGYSIEFYTWERNGGVLKHHHFELRENGEITEHLEKELGYNIGPYITI